VARTSSKPSGKPTAAAPDSRRLVGYQQPRLFTPPLRHLSRKTSLGYEIADWADLIGEPFIPWQKVAAVRAMETLPGGMLRFGIVIVIVARQQGKSKLKRTVTSWRMYNRPGSKILGCAQDAGFAKEQWDAVRETIDAHGDLAAEVAKVSLRTGREWFRLANGSRYGVAAANSKAARGGSNHEASIDELKTQDSWKAYAAIAATTASMPNGQLWLMSNAGDDDSVVLNQLRAAALAGTDPRICILEYSAPYNEDTGEYCELDDVNGWRHACPALGHLMSPQVLRTALASESPEIFRTERLCQRVVNLSSAIDRDGWTAGRDAGQLKKSSTIAAVFDVAPDGRHASLVGAAQEAPGVRVQVIQAWESAAQARTELPALLERLHPHRFGWFSSGPAAEMSPMLRQLAQRYNVTRGKKETEWLPEGGEIAAGKAVEACMGLSGLARSRQVVHSGEALLDAQAAGAQKLPSGDGFRYTRSGRGHVDCVYAAAGAAQICLTMPAPRGRPRIRIVA
jgi:hypothetical protein